MDCIPLKSNITERCETRQLPVPQLCALFNSLKELKVQKELTLGKLMTVEFGLIQYLDLDNAYMKFHVKQNIRIIMLQV